MPNPRAVRLEFEYPGEDSKRETEYPGSFEKAIDDPAWARVPAIGEAIQMRGLWVVRVTWVLWSLDPEDDIVIHVETLGSGFTVPTRAQLIAEGWREA